MPDDLGELFFDILPNLEGFTDALTDGVEEAATSAGEVAGQAAGEATVSATEDATANVTLDAYSASLESSAVDAATTAGTDASEALLSQVESGTSSVALDAFSASVESGAVEGATAAGENAASVLITEVQDGASNVTLDAMSNVLDGEAEDAGTTAGDVGGQALAEALESSAADSINLDDLTGTLSDDVASMGTEVGSKGSTALMEGLQSGAAGLELSHSFGGLGAALGAVFAAGFGIKAEHAFETLEGFQKRLQFNLAKVGAGGEETFQSLVHWIEDFSAEAGQSTVAITDMTGRLVGMATQFFKTVGPEGGQKAIKLLAQDIVDLAAKTGRSTSVLMRTVGSTILNAPARAIPMLKKFGALTDEQIVHINELIAAGDNLAASQAILVDVEENVGGAAAAQVHPIDKLRLKFEELELQVGQALFPAFNAFADVLTSIPKPILTVAASVAVLAGAGSLALFSWHKMGTIFKFVSDRIGPLITAYMAQTTATEATVVANATAATSTGALAVSQDLASVSAGTLVVAEEGVAIAVGEEALAAGAATVATGSLAVAEETAAVSAGIFSTAMAAMTAAAATAATVIGALIAVILPIAAVVAGVIIIAKTGPDVIDDLTTSLGDMQSKLEGMHVDPEITTVLHDQLDGFFRLDSISNRVDKAGGLISDAYDKMVASGIPAAEAEKLVNQAALAMADALGGTSGGFGTFKAGLDRSTDGMIASYNASKDLAESEFSRTMTENQITDALMRQQVIQDKIIDQQHKATISLARYSKVTGIQVDLTKTLEDGTLDLDGIMSQAAADYKAWGRSIGDSINLVTGKLGDLLSQDKITARGIARNLDKSLAKMRSFGKNLQTIADDNTEGSRALVQQLIAAGPAGVHMAQVIAHATPEVRKHIEDDIQKSLKLAKQDGKSLEDTLTGGFTNIAAAILVATGKADSLKEALAELDGMTVTPQIILGFVSGSNLHGFAEGGSVPAHQPIVVGEQGFEIFEPPSAGTIIPHAESMAIMSGQQQPTETHDETYNITVTGDSSPSQRATQIVRELRRMHKLRSPRAITGVR